MEDWNWFMYGSVGEYYTTRKRLNKEDKKLFDFMTDHFEERYSKLTDEDEKEEFIEKVEDIFCDFSEGPDFWEPCQFYCSIEKKVIGVDESLPFWKKVKAN